MSSHDVRKNAQWRQAGGGDGGSDGEPARHNSESMYGQLASRYSTGLLITTAAISGQEYQDPAQVREHKVRF